MCATLSRLARDRKAVPGPVEQGPGQSAAAARPAAGRWQARGRDPPIRHCLIHVTTLDRKE